MLSRTSTIHWAGWFPALAQASEWNLPEGRILGQRIAPTAILRRKAVLEKYPLPAVEIPKRDTRTVGVMNVDRIGPIGDCVFEAAAVSHRFGKGEAVLIPSTIGDLYLNYRFPDARRLILNAARMLAAPPVEVVGTDEFVEMTWRRAADRSLGLHLINWASGERPASGAIPLGPITVRVRMQTSAGDGGFFRSANQGSKPRRPAPVHSAEAG